MKWIGQHIVDFIARFRSDVYLENIADGTVASDKFLGLDSNNKIVKEAVSAGITVSDSTANTDFPIVFHDESNNLHDDTGSFTYNPSVGTLKVTDLDITGVANALTVSSTDGNVAISTLSTDPDCMIRVQDSGTGVNNAMGMVATSDDLVMRNDEGNFKVKTNNNADTALLLTQAGSMVLLGGLAATGITIGAHTVNDIDIAGEFVDSDEHLMTSAAINDRIAAVAGGGKGFLQWYYYSANLSTTNGFYIEKWNDEYGVASSINSQIADYNDTASSHWQVIRGSRIVPYDATVTKFLVNVENSGTNEDIDVALWKATPSVTSRSSSGTSTTIDHLCTLTYDFTSYSGSGTWTKSTTSFNATSLTQGEYLFVTLKRTSGTDGSSYHVHSTVTFDY